MEEFFQATQVELSVVAADITANRVLVLSHATAPDCPVVWAVRMSMSIPLVWDAVVWKPEWGGYLGHPMDKHFVVDGGILSNFPIELFISDEPQVTRLTGPKRGTPVMGLMIDESLALPARKGLLVDVHVDPNELKTVQRLKALIDTMTGAHDKMVIEDYAELVVRLPAAGYGTTEFDMRDERRNALVAAGREAMRPYLDTHPASRESPLKSSRPKKARGKQTAADRIAGRLLQTG